MEGFVPCHAPGRLGGSVLLDSCDSCELVEHYQCAARLSCDGQTALEPRAVFGYPSAAQFWLSGPEEGAMARLILSLLVVAAVGGSAYFFLNYDVGLHRTEDGDVQYIQITPRGGTPGDTAIQKPLHPSIRIATFNVGPLDENKLNDRLAGDVLVRLIPQFDIVAIQDVRAENQGVLARLVERINATGQQYDFATCPSVRLGPARQYSAFLFNRATIEIDGTGGCKAQSVEDPQKWFRHRPLVAWFRVRGAAEGEAFTFKLINVHTDPDRAAVELDLLDDVYRAVRDAGPDEDDIILLGDFGIAAEAGQVKDIPDIAAAISGTATTFRGTQTVDNILFNRRATAEFTGKSAVLDLVREFKLKPSEARQISNHLPVWAEFSSYEGVASGHIESARP